MRGIEWGTNFSKLLTVPQSSSKKNKGQIFPAEKNYLKNHNFLDRKVVFQLRNFTEMKVPFMNFFEHFNDREIYSIMTTARILFLVNPCCFFILYQIHWL